ncbi:hypothetical protein ACFVFS_07345 [Kitasatospora sp. NPDC057692]|uniref:hypothetical protein n=1 Tax=Kitasatospora sp. NPDC057692 TaxID=3346215 RepID=UPI00368B1753
MITKHSAPAAVPRRLALALAGYRGPLLLAAVLVLVAAPEGAGLGSLRVTVLSGAVVAAFLAPLALVVALILGSEVLALSPAVRRRVYRFQRPGNSVLSGCLLASAAVAFGFSVPGWDYEILTVGLAALGLIPLAWFAWQLVVTRGPAQQATAGRPGGRWRWAAVPLLIAATALLVSQGVPREVRFALARPALTSYAERALATATVDPGPTRIGGFRIKDTQLADGGVKFPITTSGLFANHGYAYFPQGPTHPDSYDHVGGHWYSWSGPDRF